MNEQENSTSVALEPGEAIEAPDTIFFGEAIVDSIASLAVRRQLRSGGYSPLPIVNGAKRPRGEGWQNKIECDPAEFEEWERSYPEDRGTGILTKFSPALDIDINHDEASNAIEALARIRFYQSLSGKIMLGCRAFGA
jgi:hypothetical protein